MLDIALIILTSTLISIGMFASYQLGVKAGMYKQSQLDKKNDEVMKILNQDSHNKMRDYKQMAEYNG